MKYGISYSCVDSKGYYTGRNGIIDFDGDWKSEACTNPMLFDTKGEAEEYARKETERLNLYNCRLNVFEWEE